jgi:hypothetical protein
MYLRYVGHSCLRIEMAGQHILTNPWWEGPAYDGLWRPDHPRVERSDQEIANLVMITDEGEDHLHVPTLKKLSRQATILVPRSRDLSLRDFLLSLGFENVIEMAHQRQHTVAPGVQATIYRHGDGNLLVIQGEGRTVLHANSALQSGSMHALLATCNTIRQRHPRIDLLFASRHNHSWLPYCARLLGDTPLHHGRWEKSADARFLQLVRFFEPRMAFPIEDAPKDLINDPSSSSILAEVFYEPTSADDLSNRVQEMLEPGDCIVGDQFVPGQPATGGSTDLLRLPNRNGAGPTDPVETVIDPERWRKLQRRILRNLQERAPRLLRGGRQVRCRIELADYPGTFLYLDASSQMVLLEPCDALRLAPLTITLRLDVLESWANNVSGFRTVATAMGAEWQLSEDQMVHAVLLLDLMGRRTLPASWVERMTLWLLHPRRSWDIWNQRRLHRCQESQQEELDRIDPYRLLQADPATEELPSVAVLRSSA